jgi:C_GCAxxG_C_C family probable redox protein
MSDPFRAVAEDSVKYFVNKLYCSEAILKAFNEHYVLGVPDQFLKIATSFGAGLGASKCCCGALTGGILVLSLITGRNSPDEPEGPAFTAASALHDEFKHRYTAACCRVLTRLVPWGSPEHHRYCQQFVYGAAEITAAILADKFGIYPGNYTRGNREIAAGG